MTIPTGEVIESMLMAVDAPRRFVNRTEFEGTVIDVDHLVETLSARQVRVVYRIEVRGANAEQVGRAVSADFPEVLRGLAGAAAG